MYSDLPAHTRCTKGETQIRIAFIVTLLLRFHTYTDIVAELKKKYAIKDTRAKILIKKAKKELSLHTISDNVQAITSMHIQAREQLLRDTCDDKLKLDILKDIAKLQGVSEQTIHVKHSNTDIPTEQLISALANLPIDEG